MLSTMISASNKIYLSLLHSIRQKQHVPLLPKLSPQDNSNEK